MRKTGPTKKENLSSANAKLGIIQQTARCPPARPDALSPIQKNTLPKSANSSFAAIFLVGGILEKKSTTVLPAGKTEKKKRRNSS